jgi:hypothetical protein
MGVKLLLEKASSTHPDQIALGSRAGGLRYGDLARAADHRHLSGSWSTTSRFVTPEAHVSDPYGVVDAAPADLNVCGESCYRSSDPLAYRAST